MQARCNGLVPSLTLVTIADHRRDTVHCVYTTCGYRMDRRQISQSCATSQHVVSATETVL